MITYIIESLEEENTKLKKLLAGYDLDHECSRCHGPIEKNLRDICRRCLLEDRVEMLSSKVAVFENLSTTWIGAYNEHAALVDAIGKEDTNHD